MPVPAAATANRDRRDHRLRQLHPRRPIGPSPSSATTRRASILRSAPARRSAGPRADGGVGVLALSATLCQRRRGGSVVARCGRGAYVVTGPLRSVCTAMTLNLLLRKNEDGSLLPCRHPLRLRVQARLDARRRRFCAARSTGCLLGAATEAVHRGRRVGRGRRDRPVSAFGSRRAGDGFSGEAVGREVEAVVSRPHNAAARARRGRGVRGTRLTRLRLLVETVDEEVDADDPLPLRSTRSPRRSTASRAGTRPRIRVAAAAWSVGEISSCSARRRTTIDRCRRSRHLFRSCLGFAMPADVVTGSDCSFDASHRLLEGLERESAGWALTCAPRPARGRSEARSGAGWPTSTAVLPPGVELRRPRDVHPGRASIHGVPCSPFSTATVMRLCQYGWNSTSSTRWP